MTVTNLTEFQRNLSAFLEKASEGSEVLGVDWEGGGVVVMSGETYRGLLETMRLPRVPGLKEKLLEGMEAPLEECEILPDEVEALNAVRRDRMRGNIFSHEEVWA